MYNPDNYSVRSGNMFTLTLSTPAPEHDGEGTWNYQDLINKPRINGVELVGNVSLESIGIPDLSQVPKEPLSTADLETIINS